MEARKLSLSGSIAWSTRLIGRLERWTEAWKVWLEAGGGVTVAFRQELSYLADIFWEWLSARNRPFFPIFQDDGRFFWRKATEISALIAKNRLEEEINAQKDASFLDQYSYYKWFYQILFFAINIKVFGDVHRYFRTIVYPHLFHH